MKDKYFFRAIKSELIIREAFELIGIPGSLVVAEQLEGAKRSINFLLADLANQNVNLWTIQQEIIPLVSWQTQYSLPSNLVKVLQVNLRTFSRDLDGTATASEGIAANAFDDDSNTSCIQTTINGRITFQFNTAKQISLLGIQSMVTRKYTLQLYGTNDITIVEGDLLITATATDYTADSITWIDIPNTKYYKYYNLVETDGAILNIAEIYLEDQPVDTALSEITLDSYLRMPIKNNIGRPTIYAVDYQITPVLNLWQAPDTMYNRLIVNYQSMLPSLDGYTESINIPNTFYQAFVYGLAKSLAMKYSPDKLQYISPEFDRALSLCLSKHTNDLPLQFELNAN